MQNQSCSSAAVSPFRHLFQRQSLLLLLVAALLAAPHPAVAQAAPPTEAQVQQAQQLQRQVQELMSKVQAAAGAKDFAQVAQLLKQVIAIVPSEAPAQLALQYNLACAYAKVGQNDEALAALQKAAQRGLNETKALEENPDFAPLRQLPAYDPLLEQVRAAAEARQRQLDAIPVGKSRFEKPANAVAGKKLPLVVFLHGMGGNPDLLFQTIQPITAMGCALLAPCGSVKLGTPEKFGYNWDAAKDGERIMAEIRALAEQGTIDPKAVFLMGLSAGGNMAYIVGLTYPEAFAGLVVFSGAMEGPVMTEANFKRAAGKLPVYIVHGTKDQSMPYQLATKARDALQAQGVRVQLQSFEGGHEAPPNFTNVVRQAATWCRTRPAGGATPPGGVTPPARKP